MLHFEGHTLSIKKVMFPLKKGKYLEKDNIYGVNFVFPCSISWIKIYDPSTKFSFIAFYG